MTRSRNQILAATFGTAYLLVGLAGFAVTGVQEWVDRSGDLLVVFSVNPVHNVVHIGIGLALLAAAVSGVGAARAMNLTIGGTYLVVGIVGLFLLGSEANILALNHPDNALHIATALVLLAVAWAPEPRPTQPEPPPVQAAAVSQGWREDAWDLDEEDSDAERTRAMTVDELTADEEDEEGDEEEAPPATGTQTSGGPLEGLTKDELYREAQEADIQGRSSMTKDELMEALRSVRGGRGSL